MSIKGLMLLGMFVLMMASAIEITGLGGISVAVFAFAGGALFGKGYGIWEERQRNPSPPIQGIPHE